MDTNPLDYCKDISIWLDVVTEHIKAYGIEREITKRQILRLEHHVQMLKNLAFGNPVDSVNTDGE